MRLHRSVLVLALAGSAGVHAALTASHVAAGLETAGLVLALGLLQAARGSGQTLPTLREGVVP